MNAVIIWRNGTVEEMELSHGAEPAMSIFAGNPERRFSQVFVTSDLVTDKVDAVYAEAGLSTEEWNERLKAWMQQKAVDPELD